MSKKQHLFHATFDNIPVRFIFIPERKAVFVSNQDVLNSIRACMVDPLKAMPDFISRKGFDFFADETEKAVAVINVDTIGPVVNAYSTGNLISNLSEMHGDHQSGEALRGSSFRLNALNRWYGDTFSRATDYFGLGLKDVLDMAKEHLDRHNQAFTVSVTDLDGVWMAECDPLGLITEADSFEELTDRVWEITPELAELNGFEIAPENLRLKFEHIETGEQRLAAH